MNFKWSFSLNGIRRWQIPCLAFMWLVLVLLFFFPVVFEGKVLAPLDILSFLLRPWAETGGGIGVHNAYVYDAISQYVPYDWSVYRSLHDTGSIGWNPNVYGGYAILENTMQCPGDWHHLLYRILPFWDGWNYGIILQFFLAGLGMMVLFREENIPAFLWVLGAVSYGFFSTHITWIYHRWVLGTTCWFPWIVWAVRRSGRKGRIFDFSSVVFTALAFRGGHLQSCLFVVALVACLFWDELARNHPSCGQAVAVRTGRPDWHLIVFYAILAIGSTLLAADMFVNVLPPYFAAHVPRDRVSLLASLMKSAGLITLFFPTQLGTPQSLPLLSPFGSGLFDTFFIGVPVAVLGIGGFCRKKAPRLPKRFVLASLVLCFTPLCTWFYQRVAPLFALGLVWLAAWEATRIAHEGISPRARRWTWLFILGIVLCWTAASLLVWTLREPVLSALRDQAVRSLSPRKASRLLWMSLRAENTVRQSLIWFPRNVSQIALVVTGLAAAFRLSSHSERQKHIAAGILTLATFLEIVLYANTWITFAPRPENEEAPYPMLDWTKDLRDCLDGRGFLYCADLGSDFDYFQINSQSVYGIPAFQGYETIPPKHLCIPGNPGDFIPEDFAACGISHVLLSPASAVPKGLESWHQVCDSSAFRLYENPAFAGLRRVEGDVLTILHPYHRYWHATLNGKELPVEEGNNHTIQVSLPSAESNVEKVLLEFRPHNLRFLPLQATIFLLLFAATMGNRRNISR